MIIKAANEIPLDEIVACHTNIGIEVEKVRVDPENRLSERPFPANFNADMRDFVEHEFFNAQIEFALPFEPVVDKNLARGEQIIRAAASHLAPDERLWPYSCPPPLSEMLAQKHISRQPTETYDYRERLSHIYDLRRILNTGIHINLSFSEQALTELLRLTDFTTTDELYVHLAQYFMLHRWLFTYLFGATPLAFAGYFPGDAPTHPVRSLRSSPLGFPTNIHGDYHSVSGYVARIEKALEKGELLAPGQYYEPVRLKSKVGKDPRALLTEGVSHLELRGFDLNPNTATGVAADQLRLVQSLALFFATQPVLEADEFEVRLAESRILNNQIALEDPRDNSICQERAIGLLSRLCDFARYNHFPAAYQQAIAHYLDASIDTRASLSYTVWQQLAKIDDPVAADACAIFF
ncbi:MULTISPECIES: hypothetical protein [unclassified Lacticaseibacillus]|uniref:hypothetical protein n=1 Tax=unclassified Lacticaseibacillus TaxID=2759744 RepID=UPI001940FDE1|nr:MULTISPECIES: hypothetical protein [unclassified Lacticaseibacillus]